MIHTNMNSNNEKPVRCSVRLDNFDYSTVGGYYVTICTANRKPIFGEFLGGEVVLNNYGEFACDEWMRTGDVRKNVRIDEFIIMPNHIHGIIIIKPNNLKITARRGMAPTCPSLKSSPDSRTGLPASNPYGKREFGKPQTGSLGIIIAI